MTARGVACRASSLLMVMMLLGAEAAYAHPRLLHTRPAAGSSVAAADATDLRLTFNETPEAAPSRLRLTGPDGQVVSLAPLKAASGDPRSLVTALPPGLPPGRYVVVWHVAGDDGHMVMGSFAFVISPAAGVAPAEVPPHDAPPPSDSTLNDRGQRALEAPAFIVSRWLMYASLMTLIGAVAFRVLVLRRATRVRPLPAGLDAAASRRAAALGLIAAAALLASLPVRLLAQHAAMSGGEGPGPAMWDVMLARTTWGHAWLAQLAGAIAATLLCAGLARRAPRGESLGTGWVALAGVVAALALTPAFSGHAIAAGRLTALAVAADGIHVLAAGAWLGTLLAVLAAGIPSAYRSEAGTRAETMARLVAAFSSLALVSAATLVVTGVFAWWIHVGNLAALWHTGYGRALLIKLAVLTGVAATGAFNWKWVQPGLADVGARGERAAARLRVSARAELAIGAVVVLVTAILVALPTPHDLP